MYTISEMIKKNMLLLLMAFVFAGCTRDDICPEETQTTPSLVIKFKDISNPSEVKAVSNLRITLADENQTEVVAARTDTIYNVPLNPVTMKVLFNFTKDFEGNATNTDVLSISYQRGEDVYINRACAFRTTFTDVNPMIQPEGSANWMLTTDINNATVANEDVTHITIFH